jgi:hypothetical protein
MRPRWILLAPIGLLAIALFAFLGGEVVRLLWNYVVPPLFGWREITFWQALGLLALCRILFGGFGIHGNSRSHSALKHRLADRMADRVAARWEHMSPEERERFRQRIRERCGFDLATGDSAGQ